MSARFSGPAAFLAIALAALLVDFVTKNLVLQLLPLEGVRLLPGFNLHLGFNGGVSFELFAGDGNRLWIAGFTGSALALLATFGLRAASPVERAGYALIAGGGFANLIDRLHDGVVTDFLDVHAVGWHFPTFNLADASITGGAILMAWALQCAPKRSS